MDHKPGPEPPEPVFAWRPECHLCSWAWAGGRFRLKFVNRACGMHKQLLEAA